MSDVSAVLEWVNLLAFCALALVGGYHWYRQRDKGSMWFFFTFLVLGSISIVGRLLDDADTPRWEVAVLISILVLFPYFLYRLAVSFEPPRPTLERIAAGLTAVIIVWAFLVPEFPQEGDPRSPGVVAFIVGLLVQWVFLSFVLVISFWRGGSAQPLVARRRMRLMAIAAAMLSVALVIAGAAPSQTEEPGVAQVITQILTIVSAAAFYLGFAPPRWLREVWRRPVQEDVRRAIGTLMAAESADDVSRSLMPHARALVSANGIALYDKDGNLVASEGVDPETIDSSANHGAATMRLSQPGGTIVLATSSYTPFFGQDEVELLGALATIANLAIERIRAGELRSQLERAQIKRQQALEINDNVVQGLAVAKYSLDLGRLEEASKAVEGTLAAARAIISDLLADLGDDVFKPGMLVRDQPATGFGSQETLEPREWRAKPATPKDLD
jgi:hypothetical protein